MSISTKNHAPDNFWEKPLPELQQQLHAKPEGLSNAEAAERLHLYGPNSIARESRYAILFRLLGYFTNPLVLILLFASIFALLTGAAIESSIIITIVILSVLLNFFQEFQARHAAEKLRQQVAVTAAVVRDGKEQELPVDRIVPGDIIHLNAGDLVPADMRLLEAKDLHVRESSLTGESLPVEKTAKELPSRSSGITEADNSVFMGTSIQTGIGTGVVVHTGVKTAFGAIAAHLTEQPPETEFDRGIHQFGLLITRIILLLVPFVFLVNLLLHRSVFDSFLFAIALAVGLTPELLPMIISVTLAQGARRMAAKKVIVKQLASIENFGSMEILCSDKTGTLTEGDIILDKHVDITGAEDEYVMQLLYLNSYFEAGIKSPLDDAVLKHEHPTITEYRKVDEVPFDFQRKRLSVVVERDDKRMLVTKGSAESIFTVCTAVETAGQQQSFEQNNRQLAQQTYENLSSEGYRLLGVAIRIVGKQDAYTEADEQEMTLVGFGAFLDPPKEGVSETLNLLKRDGIRVVIMTGDNQFVTRKTASDVGLPADSVLVASQVDALDDAALAYQAEHGAIFAHVSPEQKNRVINALKAHGRVVGFLGDGINDAPSLHTADIGISVVNGVDVAKEAANIILMEKSLNVLHDGILEGRRSFANIMKYIVMGTSSNFGNMFSMAIGSLILPFLPLLPMQVLLNNLLYDTSQISIPSDNVDKRLLHRPRRWNINFIRQFMITIGPISSVYDLITFWILLSLFNGYHNERLFHTGWFVESLATQTLVVFVIRTAGNPFRSRPSNQLIAAVTSIAVLAIVIPFTGIGTLLGFTPLPITLLLVIFVLTVTYLGLVQWVKRWFYRRHKLF